MPEINCPKCGRPMAAGGVLCSSCMQLLSAQSSGQSGPNFQPPPPGPIPQPSFIPGNPPPQGNQPAVLGVYVTPPNILDYRRARTRGEIRVLLITLILLLVLFFIGVVATAGSKLDVILGEIFAALVVTAFYLFILRLSQRQFLGDALRVERGHFSNLKATVGQVAALLNTTEPEVYIFQDPYLNAFSLGFKHPYTVALHSAIVENLDQEELTAVLIHEVGHIWFGHTRISAYVTPVVFQVPIVSPVMQYIFGFWARRTELSCDRLALLVTRNPRAVIDGLIKSYVGPHFLQQLDTEGVLFQEHQTQGLLNKLAQSMTTHPFMTTRIRRLLEYARELGLVYIDKNGLLVCENCGLKSQSSTVVCTRCGMQLRRPM